MKRIFPVKGILATVVFLCMLISAPTAFSFDGPTHALIAREGEGLPYGGYVCGYWARTGAVAVDFAWYLGDFRDLGNADALHDEFLKYVDECTNHWNFTHRCFEYGAETHLCADIIADGTLTIWTETFLGRQDVPDGLNGSAVHLTLEFAVGSLVVDERLQLWDLIFLYQPAKLVECLVSPFLGSPPPFDVRSEFKTYMALTRMLEKAAKIYAPYLRGEVGEEFLDQIDISDLLTESLELSDGALSVYLEVLNILLTYPTQIRDTITCCPDWEDALEEAKTTCPTD